MTEGQAELAKSTAARKAAPCQHGSLYSLAQKGIWCRHEELEPIRIAPNNVDTLAGRHRELADLPKRGRVDTVCIQKTA